MKSAALFIGLASIGFCSLMSGTAQSPSASAVSPHRESDVVSVPVLSLPPKASRAFEKGSRLLREGDAAASIRYFQTVVELAPDNYAPYHNLAVAHYSLGHLDDAVQNFRKAILLSKASFAPSLFGLCMVLYRRAEFQEAETLAQQGLSLAPDSAPGAYYLGLIQYTGGRTTDAQRSALNALRLDPSLADAHLLLAHIHERLLHPEAVLVEVDEYLKRTKYAELSSDALALRQRAQTKLASLPVTAPRSQQIPVARNSE